MFLHVDSKDSDQTGWMSRLISLRWAQMLTCRGSNDNYGYSLSTANSSGVDFVSNWLTYVPLVLVNSLGGLGLPRNSVSGLTDQPDMTLVAVNGP